MYFIINILLCFVIGLFYASGELIRRFRNVDLMQKIGWCYAYLIVNGILAAVAFVIIKGFDFNYLNYHQIEGGRIMLASGSSMVIIRSWLLSVREPKVNEKGHDTFTPIIEVFLEFIQRQVDKRKAELEAKAIEQTMSGLDFELAAFSLPFLCQTSLVTLTDAEGKYIAKRVNDIRKMPMGNDSKLLSLGILVNRYTGLGLLGQIVEHLKSSENRPSPIKELNSFLEQFKD